MHKSDECTTKTHSNHVCLFGTVTTQFPCNTDDVVCEGLYVKLKVKKLI